MNWAAVVRRDPKGNADVATRSGDSAVEAADPTTLAPTGHTESSKKVAMVDYQRVQHDLLVLPTESIAAVLEFLPVRDVVKTSLTCKRLLMIGELDSVWSTHFREIQQTIEVMGLPFVPLPDARRSPRVKDVAVANMRYSNRDAQRALELGQLVREVEEDGKRRILLRVLGEPVRNPEQMSFLLDRLQVLAPQQQLFSAADVLTLVDHLAVVPTECEDFAVDVTDAEDPEFLSKLLIGISPRGPANPNNLTHFGRSIRLVEIGLITALDLLRDQGPLWMCTALTTFSIDSKLTRFFTAPELCRAGRVGVVAADHLRVLVLRDRIRRELE